MIEWASAGHQIARKACPKLFQLKTADANSALHRMMSKACSIVLTAPPAHRLRPLLPTRCFQNAARTSREARRREQRRAAPLVDSAIAAACRNVAIRIIARCWRASEAPSVAVSLLSADPSCSTRASTTIRERASNRANERSSNSTSDRTRLSEDRTDERRLTCETRERRIATLHLALTRSSPLFSLQISHPARSPPPLCCHRHHELRR